MLSKNQQGLDGSFKIGADNRAPRLQFHDFESSIHLVAGSAALTGAVADLARSTNKMNEEIGIRPLQPRDVEAAKAVIVAGCREFFGTEPSDFADMDALSQLSLIHI